MYIRSGVCSRVCDGYAYTLGEGQPRPAAGLKYRNIHRKVYPGRKVVSALGKYVYMYVCIYECMSIFTYSG
jgi:hypothetical protein